MKVLNILSGNGMNFKSLEVRGYKSKYTFFLPSICFDSFCHSAHTHEIAY